jgi:hypothetical protein
LWAYTCWVVSKTPIGIQKCPLRSPCLLLVCNPRNSIAFGRDTYSTCAFETWCYHVCTTCVTLTLTPDVLVMTCCLSPRTSCISIWWILI